MYKPIIRNIAIAALSLGLSGCPQYTNVYCSPGGQKARSTFDATTYITKPGDTLENITETEGTTIEKILVLNEINDPDFIVPDAKLCIPTKKK